MLEKFLGNTVYVKITKNQFRVRNIESQQETTVTALEPFTTKRLLVGEFSTAENYLKTAIKKVQHRKWFSSSPVVVIHPMEMVDGGLSQVEERVFRELSAGAGARKVVLWLGHELSNREVIANARNG